MNILDLDVYSLRIIFSLLEPESYINAMQTCQTFRKLSCNFVVDQKKWTYDLKKRFVKLIGTIVDRDNMYNTHKGYYVLLVSLKAFLQTLKVTDFLRYYSSYTDDISQNDLSKLILKSAEAEDFCLDQVIHISHFLSISANISNWFSFDFNDGTQLIICCVFSLTLYLFFVVNTSRTQLYHSEDGSNWNTLTFDEDGESSKLEINICDEIVRNIVRKLSLLTFNDENHLTLSTFLEFSKLSFPVVVNQKDYSTTLISNDRTQVKVDHLENAFKSNITQILPLLPHDRSKEKFISFFKLLNTFRDISDFDSIVKYTQALMRYSVPFTKVLCRFGYGELLGYLPIAQKILMRAEYSNTTEKDVTLNMGSSVVLIKRTSMKRDFIISVMNVATSDSYQLQLEEAANVAEDEQLADLIKLFDNFVEVNFRSPKLDLIPEISVAFLRDMFSCLFANLSHLI